jgi:hypothetical protein
MIAVAIAASSMDTAAAIIVCRQDLPLSRQDFPPGVVYAQTSNGRLPASARHAHSIGGSQARNASNDAAP